MSRVAARDHDVASYTSRAHEAFAVRRGRWRDAAVELGLPADVRWWSSNQVADWAAYVGFARYGDDLVRHNVSGEVLLVADMALLKEIDVKAAGDRVMLLRARDMLAQSSTPFLQFQPPPQDHRQRVPASRYAVQQHPLKSNSDFYSGSRHDAAGYGGYGSFGSSGGYSPQALADLQSPQHREQSAPRAA